MCGRYGIEPALAKQVEEDFNISFQFDADSNICPSQLLPTIIKTEQGLQQFNGSWGIQPSWSKKLLINAQSETAATKPTFKKSFENYRCIIPMSYWFEWCNIESPDKKIKYKFTSADNMPLYMAGIFFPTSADNANIVSLTTAPTEQCMQYHHRMPLLVDSDWLESGTFKTTNKQFNISN